MAELAQEFSGALGRTIQYVNVPPQIWEVKLHEARLPAHLTAHLITMGQLNRDNRYDSMTDTFRQLVGRAPISPPNSPAGTQPLSRLKPSLERSG